MNKSHPNRVPRNFRLSQFTVSELRRLSAELDTNMTQIIEIAVTQFSQNYQSRQVRS